MNTRQRLLTTLPLCAVAALFILPYAGAARAAGEGEPRRQVNITPPVSIAAGQTLRVNFLNTGRSPFEIIPCTRAGFDPQPDPPAQP